MKMSSNNWIRHAHRWLSIAFLFTVVANFIARSQGEPAAWITYSPFLPLALLMLTGLYMFALSSGADYGPLIKLEYEPWNGNQKAASQ